MTSLKIFFKSVTFKNIFFSLFFFLFFEVDYFSEAKIHRHLKKSYFVLRKKKKEKKQRYAIFRRQSLKITIFFLSEIDS